MAKPANKYAEFNSVPAYFNVPGTSYCINSGLVIPSSSPDDTAYAINTTTATTSNPNKPLTAALGFLNIWKMGKITAKATAIPARINAHPINVLV